MTRDGLITHPDKILFPKDKITKLELVEYYRKVSSRILPLIKDRPISMKRFPRGIKEGGFFQKNAPRGMPTWIKTVKVARKKGPPIHMILCNDKRTLLWLANQNCITPHIWLSTIHQPDCPDRIVFDLDPPSEKFFSAVIEAALLLREILQKKFKLHPFVTTTGSKGLHVVVPIKPTLCFDEVRMFARMIAEAVVERDPKKYTTEVHKEKRHKKIYIDTLRNAKGQTVAAPYAVRSLDGAPVATPLFWEELRDPRLRSNTFTIRTIAPRLKKNPWATINRKKVLLKSQAEAIPQLLSDR